MWRFWSMSNQDVVIKQVCFTARFVGILAEQDYPVMRDSDPFPDLKYNGCTSWGSPIIHPS
jgi:hypothetical protein